MKAVVIPKRGGPEVLELRDVPTPMPARGEVRVRVRATAVNRADILQRMGLYPAPKDAPQDIPGLEFSGEVDEIGDAVTEVARGDRVFGLAAGGTYAEYVTMHERAVVRIPDALGFLEAAAVPEAFVTAFDAMALQGGLRAGEAVLIHAVGSGVGSAAVQIARAMGARSIGTTRTEAKLTKARELGLDVGIAVEQGGSFADRVIEGNRGRGVQVVLELVGGAYVNEDLRAVESRGRILLVGLMAGARTEIDLGMCLQKRVSIHGTVLRSRPFEEKIGAAQALKCHIVPLLASGRVAPVVDRAFALTDAAEAHRYVQSGAGFGKVVLEVGS